MASSVDTLRGRNPNNKKYVSGRFPWGQKKNINKQNQKKKQEGGESVGRNKKPSLSISSLKSEVYRKWEWLGGLF